MDNDECRQTLGLYGNSTEVTMLGESGGGGDGDGDLRGTWGTVVENFDSFLTL